MYARVMQVYILPGKLQEFLATVDTLRAPLRKQAGFRAFLTLCSPETPPATNDTRETQVTTISVWESMEALRASERNLFLYQVLARLSVYYKGFPQIREEEVLASELAAAAYAHDDDTTRG